ncbi:NAD(P)H-dependent oxidoreductase [Metabacillus sp. KIGAM252]|uniref:NAD(P)H-dependent oxidoreductase n=1 Tax=Metabacillus flavus TaxID=2823519 RepID=A0ABS5LBI5_9BACI|nr:NAD(P)H-dependent oxidoreductase [Metabacillus flavus]MBS2968070.1 NAD(P)H-dependent oxidoreductase [Metabacillus flavus]
MNVLVLSGGPRKHGRSAIAAKCIAENHKTDLIDLSQFALPLFTGEESQAADSQVKKLKEAAEKADGFVLLSPEYHGGIAGALKNALDFLNSGYFAQKPVALVSVAGGGKGGINTLNQMRTIMRALYANTIAKQLVLDPHCFDMEAKALNAEPAGLVNELMDELALYLEISKQIKKP